MFTVYAINWLSKTVNSSIFPVYSRRKKDQEFFTTFVHNFIAHLHSDIVHFTFISQAYFTDAFSCIEFLAFGKTNVLSTVRLVRCFLRMSDYAIFFLQNLLWKSVSDSCHSNLWPWVVNFSNINIEALVYCVILKWQECYSYFSKKLSFVSV